MIERTISTHFNKQKSGYLLDLLGLVLVYFIPSLAHLTGIPFYLFEPMRLMLVLSLLHANRYHAYFLAIGLPLFSFLIASHPVPLKAVLISVELMINVVTYFWLTRKQISTHWAILIAIIFSKVIYYGLKFFLIKSALLESSLISTPLYIQLITTTIFSVYGFVWYKKIHKKN